MPGSYGLAVWGSPQWRAQAASWLDEQLAAAGLARTGEVTQPHLRAWGTVLRAPTTDGPVWLKAPGPGTAFEVELYRLLARVAPDRVLPALAADPRRGWLLLPDGGPTLGERVTGGDLVEALVVILPQYGQLQRDLAGHVDELLAFGVTDMRAAVMPQRFDEALTAAREYLGYAGTAPDWALYHRIVGARASVAAWCQRLAGAPVPPSLDHNDLHPFNIFLAGTDGASPAGPARFYDWGDSVVAHPFASLLVGLGFLHQSLGAGPDDPQIVRPRDAYLEVFSDLASHAELVETIGLACSVGKIARALTWHRSLRAQGLEQAGEHARAPLESLASMLGPSYLTLGA
ncbi:MAG: phosphotransferase [Micromonosporaceae bacterium]|nr:phosphotransferase [Micromonosporaceae bacterium]